MRDGADHLMIVEYDTKRMRVPFSEDLTTAKHRIRRKTPISAPYMTKALNVHAHNARERTAFTMHSVKDQEGRLHGI